MKKLLSLGLVTAALAGIVTNSGAADAQTSAGQNVSAQAPAPGAAPAGPPPMPKPITLAARPNATGGEALFVEHCISCHGPNGMGTGLLARRLAEGELEKRKLVAAYVVQAARIGIGNMPAIPRGEVSDADLQAIANYLAAGPHGAAR